MTTNKGTKHHAPIVVIAGGLGGFQPRKPNFDGIESFEEKGVSYFIKEPNIYIDKNVIISGGGDSALDWTIELSKIAKKVTLVHRRNEFRGASDSVDKVQKLKDENKMTFDNLRNKFELKLKLKQGFYNYKYIVADKSKKIIKNLNVGGNFDETENKYSVVVYYRENGGRYDKVVGYSNASSQFITN